MIKEDTFNNIATVEDLRMQLWGRWSATNDFQIDFCQLFLFVPSGTITGKQNFRLQNWIADGFC